MTEFSPIDGLVGGSMIGLAAAGLLLFNGDILGASGIVNSLLLSPLATITKSSQLWKLVLLVSFVLTTQLHIGRTDVHQPSAYDTKSSILHVLAGFLVGAGTKLGNGCTSGHGICGLARMSKRSFLAVATFMATAFTTFAGMKSLGLVLPAQDPEYLTAFESKGFAVALTSSLIAALASYPSLKSEGRHHDPDHDFRKFIPAAISGALFAEGLFVSGMFNAAKVNGFLNIVGILDGSFDATLAFVMIGGLIVSFASYQFVSGFNIIKNPKALACPLALKPTRGGSFRTLPTNKTLDWQLITGAVLFGMGWGIAGICPGPALLNAALGKRIVIDRWWPAYFAGVILAQKLKGK